ncbi:MAG: GNAT family N-acetyltransferase [Anaerolineae bacterium]
MTIQALGAESTETGIRPLKVPQDLGQLADLIEIAFGSELVMTDSHMVEDMRQAARLGGLLWLTSGSRLDGFVYVEEGRLVGNVTLSQDPRDPASWFISNVAVLPERRGLHIASRLMDTSLAYLRDMHARWVRLQVRADYPVAYGLYKRRGFTVYDTTDELKLEARLLNADLAGADSRLRPVRPRDSRALGNLVLQTSVPILVAQGALRSSDYRHSWLDLLDNWLESWLQGSTREELVGYEKGKLVAFASLKSDSNRSPYQCELRVLPGHRGQWEEALVRQLVLAVLDRPRKNIHASISLTHPEALDALQRLGFSKQRSLAQMNLLMS